MALFDGLLMLDGNSFTFIKTGTDINPIVSKVLLHLNTRQSMARNLEKIKSEVRRCKQWFIDMRNRLPNNVPLQNDDYELLRDTYSEEQKKIWKDYVIFEEVKVVPMPVPRRAGH